MSYATSLLAGYPTSYGASTLFSDNLLQRSSFDELYHPSVGYGDTNRLFSDDLTFGQITPHQPTTYRPPIYNYSNPTNAYPQTNYENSPIINYRKPPPPNDSNPSLKDIPEYSESLVTASNTNTASSVARSLYDKKTNIAVKKFPNQQMKSTWNAPNTKTKGQLNDANKKITTKPQATLTTGQNQVSMGAFKDSSNDKLNDDLTPVQSPHQPLPLNKQPNHLQRNATIAEIEKQPPAIDIQAWVNDTKKGSSPDEKEAQEAWSVKINQLQMVQAQHEREKTKSLRALPSQPKKVENKAFVNKKKAPIETKPQDSSYQRESYFDTLFDGDYFRKPSTNNYSVSSSFHNKKTTKSKLSQSLSNLNTISSKTSKQTLQQKKPRYEPPTSKRAPPPTITTTSWRKNWPHHYPFDSVYPYHYYNEFVHRDFVHKDPDERFREALQKLRHDRAEQQHKEINEKTAKRLQYGDYVRHSTKDGLLHNAVKPSPWSDFMDLKKGNIYSLSREEKKELYNQSKSYGERVRYRNFAYSYGPETTRSYHYSAPLTDDSQESEASDTTPRPKLNQNEIKSNSRTSKRPGSGSTARTSNKNFPKPIGARGGNRAIPNQTSRTTNRTDRSNPNRPSENDDEDISNYDTNRKYQQKPKKKNVHYAKGDSLARIGNSEDENENEIRGYGQRNVRIRDGDDDLFTVREEKTLESFEANRYKKR